MPKKRDPIKEIMSQVHKDIRAGTLKLDGHQSFMAEVKRRARAAGLADDRIPAQRQTREADADRRQPEP